MTKKVANIARKSNPHAVVRAAFHLWEHLWKLVELAQAQQPTRQQQHAVPHPTRGAFVLERAMVRAARPFDHRHAAAPARDVALLLLIDESGSMGDNWDERSLIAGGIRATMLVVRAADLAHITCGVWGFTDHAEQPSAS